MATFEMLALLTGTHHSAPDSQLCFVPAGGYTAVLTQVPRRVIKLPQNRKDALGSAARRQSWLEACMGFGTVLPFCPHFEMTPEDIPALVMANAPRLAHLSERFHSKVQFQITVSWDAQGVLDRFRDTPELSALFSKGSVSPQVITDSVAALSSRLNREITQSLSHVASDTLQMPMMPDMLANVVVLQHENQLARLNDALIAIDTIWTEGLRIRQIGPAPAASFASLMPKLINRNDIALALERLEMKSLGSAADISASRRNALLASRSATEMIMTSAEILQAARRVGGDGQDFFLCTVRSDDQSITQIERKVA